MDVRYLAYFVIETLIFALDDNGYIVDMAID